MEGQIAFSKCKIGTLSHIENTEKETCYTLQLWLSDHHIPIRDQRKVLHF